MAIVVDPDLLDRNQVAYNVNLQKISVYPVGSLVKLFATGSTGFASGTTKIFTASNGLFTTWGIVGSSSILSIYTGLDAGHYLIESIDSPTSLNVSPTSFAGNTVQNFSGTSNATWDIRSGTGGSVADGVTEQCLYSFAKEEWRNDLTLYGGDDLIRHEFPFEAVTREQMELGGGSAHANWVWFNNYTRKKVRTGGWAEKNTATTTLAEWSGMITLGALDSDTQVYYQQLSASTTPANFTIQGAVNEPIHFIISGSFDSRTYLKLFARKKARTYAGSQISDIGVTTLETIVNRFPLAHATDAAIVATDGEISGSTPWHNKQTLRTRTNGVTANVNTTQGTLTSATGDFLSDGPIPVRAGDTVQITSGANIGYYTIISVNSATQLTLNTAEAGALASASSISFTVTSTYLIYNRTDGAIANVTSGSVGALTSSVGGFLSASVGDMVVIHEAGSDHRGVYKIITVDGVTSASINTSDKNFTTQASIDFSIVKPGMYLQYKQENITITATGNVTFTDNGGSPDTIARASGDWTTDGVTAGTVVTFTGTTSNNKSFTVASRTSTTLTLVAADSVTGEVATSATTTAYDAFKRVVNGVTYAFHWRVFGNSATLSQVYEFVQHQLRQSTDIDYGPASSRGDVTDLLMTFASPTGTTLDLFIDNLAAVDANNVTYKDATGGSRVEAFQAAGTLNFGTNLVNDANSRYWMFFTSVPGGSYGASDAIIVNDAASLGISGSVSGQTSISFTFDYDGNIQGSRTAGTDAAVTVVAIGLNTSQFVLTNGTIARSKANSFSLVGALERNYSNT